jgi:hypothetical protein
MAQFSEQYARARAGSLRRRGIKIIMLSRSRYLLALPQSGLGIALERRWCSPKPPRHRTPKTRDRTREATRGDYPKDAGPDRHSIADARFGPIGKAVRRADCAGGTVQCRRRPSLKNGETKKQFFCLHHDFASYDATADALGRLRARTIGGRLRVYGFTARARNPSDFLFSSQIAPQIFLVAQ